MRYAAWVLSIPLVAGCAHRNKRPLDPPSYTSGRICPRDLPDGGLIVAEGKSDFDVIRADDPTTFCAPWEAQTPRTEVQVCGGAPGHCDRCTTVEVTGETSWVSMPLQPATAGCPAPQDGPR